MGRSGLSRRAFCALVGAAAALPGMAWAADIAPWLYQARTIVTGQREETRIPGLALCLRDVLVKVSGDSRLHDLPAVDELARLPEAPVAGYAYRDLYAGRPIMDEQGTRDRPYEMTVDYDALDNR
jgi:uncharacterized protein